MSVVVVISQHLLHVFVQLANKRGFKKNLFAFCYSFLLVAVTATVRLGGLGKFKKVQ
jgi:uncharacterized membrane protein YqhA